MSLAKKKKANPNADYRKRKGGRFGNKDYVPQPNATTLALLGKKKKCKIEEELKIKINLYGRKRNKSSYFKKRIVLV